MQKRGKLQARMNLQFDSQSQKFRKLGEGELWLFQNYINNFERLIWEASHFIFHLSVEEMSPAHNLTGPSKPATGVLVSAWVAGLH